ncbi:hypothetical protein IFM89_000732 [Coptis chinensis]|uniref:ABC transporter domain-containing protein n=1 Tax=Coptis chinensis TaxID=261450 RepID=A0A835M859_9MAGN|nr:hypothetical protein IFM89_000732 [Coptis chinensis]
MEVLRRVPEIDTDNLEGDVMQSVSGEVEFKNVKFVYPSRPDTIILKDFTFKVPAGKTVALVGTSGSGKSTVVALIERFYNPNSGEILLDGISLSKLQRKWLRSQIGLVGQEPVLFAISIKENILFGKEDATFEEVVAATKASNAHDFISQFPKGYDTQVGERGIQMSGGQKQRIAIARAIIRAPRVLLLDEATSALDTDSERTVQEALDNALIGRTTIVIAHHLSTIRNVDLIVVVENGQVAETGSHDQLIQDNNGLYTSCVQFQQIHYAIGANKNASPSCSSSQTTKKDDNHSIGTNRDVMSQSNSTNFESKRRVGLGEMNTKKDLPKPSFRRLLLLNSPEWKQASSGCISAMLFGAVQPVYSLLMGSMISVYFLVDHGEIVGGRSNGSSHTNLLSSIFGMHIGTTHCMEMYRGHNCSATINHLVFLPTPSFTKKKMSSKARTSQAECSKLSKLACEAVSNLQTITAFSSQAQILDMLDQTQDGPRKESICQSWFAGLGLGLARGIVACTWALDFW